MKNRKNRSTNRVRPLVKLSNADLTAVAGGQETIEVCVGHSDNLLNFSGGRR
jgi:hypothetical protein